MSFILFGIADYNDSKNRRESFHCIMHRLFQNSPILFVRNCYASTNQKICHLSVPVFLHAMVNSIPAVSISADTNQLLTSDQPNESNHSAFLLFLQVLAMMHYEETRETNPEGAALPPSLEPKMTRSRARQLLAESHLTELPLTPVKRPAAASSTEQLILQEFPEDDDDEEYTPRKVDLSGMMSSPGSSAAPSSPTPSSPGSMSVCSSLLQTPATPASTVTDVEEPLCRRTRSQLPLTDQPLEELEQLVRREYWKGIEVESRMGKMCSGGGGRFWIHLGVERSASGIIC